METVKLKRNKDGAAFWGGMYDYCEGYQAYSSHGMSRLKYAMAARPCVWSSEEIGVLSSIFGSQWGRGRSGRMEFLEHQG